MKNKIKLLISILFIGTFVNVENIYAINDENMETIIDSVDYKYSENIDIWPSQDKSCLEENECNIFNGNNGSIGKNTTGKSDAYGCIWDTDTLKNGSSIIVFVSDSGVYTADVFIKTKKELDYYGKEEYEIDTIVVKKLSSIIKDGYRVHSDRDGIIWIATKKGIEYYNGDTWNSLKYGIDLPNERIENIISDKNNRIVVVTIKGAYTIKNYMVDKKYPLFNDNDIDSVQYGCFDTQNNLLLASNFGVYYWNSISWELVKFFKDSTFSSVLKDGETKSSRKSIFVDDVTGFIYFINYPLGLIKIDNINSEPIYEKIKSGYPYLSVNYNFSLIHVNNLELRVYDDNTLVTDLSTGHNILFETHLDYNAPLDIHNGEIKIKRKYFYKDSFMWYLTLNGELYITINQKNSLMTSIKELTDVNSDKLKIYPNPVSDIINIESSLDGDVFIVTKTAKIVTKVKNNKINIKNLPKGIYYGVVKQNGKIKAVKSFYKR